MKFSTTKLRREAVSTNQHRFALYVVTPGGAEVLIEGGCEKLQAEGLLEIGSSAIGATPEGALANVEIRATKRAEQS